MPTIRQLARLAREKMSIRPAEPGALPPRTSALDRQSLSDRVKDTLNILGDSFQSIMRCSLFQKRIYHAFHYKWQAPYLYNNLVKLDRLPSDDHVPLTQRFQLEVSRLLGAWQQTTQRHSILRTIFVGSSSTPGADNEVYQIVLKRITPHTQVFHVDSIEDAVIQSQSHLATFRETVFRNNLPPHSLAILIDGANSGGLYVHLILSHMLVDHVSLAHIMSDFDMFYRVLAIEPMAPSKEFGEYITQAINPRPGGDETERAMIFWETALRDTVPCIIENQHLSGTLFPTGNEAATEKGNCDYVGITASVRFAVDVTDSVTSLCKDAEVTLSNLLQFAWAVLLHILTGNEAVCFGHLVSDRDQVADDELAIVGPVLCLLVGHVTFPPNSGSVFDAMRALQNHNVASLSHTSSFDLASIERRLLFRNHECGGTAAMSGRNGSPPVLFNTLINYRKVVYSSAHDFITERHRSLWKRDAYEVCHLE